MKKILVGMALAGAFLWGAYIQAAYQPHSLGWVTLSIASGTVTEINTSTAPTVGYLRFCTNCGAAGGAGTICVSTTTNAPGVGSDFVLSTGTICK